MKKMKQWMILWIGGVCFACMTLTVLLGNFSAQTQIAFASEKQVNENHALHADLSETEDSVASVKSQKRLFGQTVDEAETEEDGSFAADVEIDIGMSIEESLYDQLAYYKALEKTETDNLNAIHEMIAKTESIIAVYAANKTDVVGQSSVNALNNTPGDDYYTQVEAYTTDIIAAIAWFNASNYALSAELLTHAWAINFTEGTYVPVHGGRVLSSKVTYDILNDNTLEGSDEYPVYSPNPISLLTNGASRNEEDLGYSIAKFDYARDSLENKKVIITDTYDFNENNRENPAVEKLVGIFNGAVSYGLIKVYEIEITVDLSEPLWLEVESMTSNESDIPTYAVRVYSHSDETLEVYYNTKMCNEGDAKNWTGLTDIETVSIPAGGNVLVNIDSNGFATHVAFSHIKGNKRIITYADGADPVDKEINTEMTKKDYTFGTVSLLGKNRGAWLLKVINNSTETVFVEYNTYMCNKSDAQSWTGLTNISSFYLSEGEERNINISEFFFATSIAVRITGSTEITTYYADDLNADCSMNLGSRTEIIYQYLSLSNAGKSGSAWNIRVTNNSDKSVVVQYNTKMCNKGDAAAWTGLQDVASFTLAAHATKTVSVQTNWFATSIAFSYIHGDGTRVITYADGLSTNGAMNVMHSQV